MSSKLVVVEFLMSKKLNHDFWSVLLIIILFIMTVIFNFQ